MLILAIVGPVAISGYSQLRTAESDAAAGDYAAAAGAFESAAARLPWRADLWERAAECALLAGRPEDAVRLLAQRSHLSEHAHVILAEAYLQLNDPNAALGALEDALARYGASAQTFSGQAAVYRAQSDWPAERAALQNALVLAPDDAGAHYRLGQLLAISDPQQALDHLLRAAQLDPEYDPAVQTLRTAVDLASMQSDPAGGLVIIGRGLALVADWQLADRAFGQAVQADPANAEAWAWWGEAKQHLGEDGGSELDRALELSPNSVVVRALRGLHWKRIGNDRQALLEYQAAAELEPDNAAWKTALGETYARLGDLVSALSVYQRATELAPRDATTWRLLATFCAEYSVQVQAVGLPAAHKAVELAPADASSLDVLGWNQLAAGLFYSAEQTLLAALAIAPDHPAAHLHLALVYLQTGDRTAAYDHLLRVRALDPGGPYGLQAEQILKQNYP